jgi:aldose 1-epimerase
MSGGVEEGTPPELIAISSERFRAEIAPAIGGSLASLTLDGVEVFRRLSEADRLAGNVIGTASFPMIPFANRIAGNAFSFEGRTYRFEANNPPEIFHVHGTAWKRAWQVESVEPTAATISLEVWEEGSFCYRAEQRFELTDKGLRLTTRVTNTGPDRMPFGFGHHPWFKRDADVTVQFNASSFSLNEPEFVIGQLVGMVPELSFAAPRGLPDYWRCTNYAGWDGEATIRFPSRGIGLRIGGDAVFRNLMFLAVPDMPVFCVEPQTNASGAFNRPGGFGDSRDNVVVLGPGEEMSGTLSFEPFRL